MIRIGQKLAALILTISFTIIPARPISQTTVNVGSAVGGVAIGAVAGLFCWHQLHENYDIRNSPEFNVLVSTLVGAGFGGLAWYILYQILYSYTAQGRIEAARTIINQIANEGLLANRKGQPEDIIKKASLVFGTSYPLVLARERLVNCVHSLGAAQALLVLADNEIENDTTLSQLGEQSEHLHDKAETLAQAIEVSLDVITANPDYRFQVNQYEKHIEAERQRAHEQAINEQKMSHESWEKFMDRLHDSKEKGKDRELKQNMVNQTQGRPTTVNINI